jgi:hypothetical protein
MHGPVAFMVEIQREDAFEVRNDRGSAMAQIAKPVLIGARRTVEPDFVKAAR